MEVSPWHGGEGAPRLGELCHQRGHVGLHGRAGQREHERDFCQQKGECFGTQQPSPANSEPELSRYFCTWLQGQLSPRDTTQTCRREEFLVWWFRVPHALYFEKILGSTKRRNSVQSIPCAGCCDKWLCCRGRSLFSPSTHPTVSGVISRHKASPPLF